MLACFFIFKVCRLFFRTRYKLSFCWAAVVHSHLRQPRVTTEPSRCACAQLQYCADEVATAIDRVFFVSSYVYTSMHCGLLSSNSNYDYYSTAVAAAICSVSEAFGKLCRNVDTQAS